MKKSILIAGGTGLVGSRLIELIDTNAFDINILSRKRKKDGSINYFEWDFKEMTIDEDAVKVDYIINLNGAGIADERWSDKRKKLLIDSRVNSSKLIKKALEKTGHRPKAYLSASAIGYYGDRGEEELNEKSDPGKGFLAECCQIWEQSAGDLENLVDRLVINRIGIVLSKKGGALPKILMTKSVGVYNYFGSGNQYYAWIHIDDLCRIFLTQLSDERYKGVFNAVGPNPIPNKEFTTVIKDTLSGILVLPVPAFGLRLAMGEMADVVLNSNRVYPKHLEKLDFNFKYSNLTEAINDLEQRKV